MNERYPNDAVLLAATQDETTGVEYIPTGRSPYHLDFRKMLYRLLRATERANDLRVYQDGDLTVGVRAGRLWLGGDAIDFEGDTHVPVPPAATTRLWLDAQGKLQMDAGGLPQERSTFLPLAEIVTSQSAIETIIDLRGQAFLMIPSLTMLGIDATAAECNQALAGVSSNVTAAALSMLTAGGQTSADTLHRHLSVPQDVGEQATFRIINHSMHADANIALQFALPQLQPADTFLSVNKGNGFLAQQHLGVAYNLLGTVQPQYKHEGELTTSMSGVLIGAVPAVGEVTDVILSIGGNIESTDDNDGLSAMVYVNGVALTSTEALLTAADGAGFVSTAQADGTSAVIVSNGDEQVQRGDVLTLDLTRTANGDVTSQARDVVVLVVIRVEAPE